MSGIGGILNLDGRPVDEEDLLRMQEALAHRGPDRRGSWRQGCVGLVHALLELDPEPPQPFQRNGCCLTLDGRIDNLPFLSRLLARSRRLPAAAGEIPSAAEGVLAGYELRGEKSLPLILGDFAFALWDGRRSRLLLARDSIGIKPLYYFSDGRRLVFASEAKAILAVSGVPCEPDEVRWGEFDRYRFRSLERTFFKGIRRLAHAEALVAQGSALRRWIYWRPNPRRRIILPNREAYRARFRRLFIEAVRCRLPKKGLAAVRLSGGLDSSAIAGTCAHIQKSERPELSLSTISILSDDFPDERSYVKTVCSAYGLPNVSFLAEDSGALDGVESALYHQESPVFDILDQPVLNQFRLAGKMGARAVLGGDWGDQVMGGGAYLVDLFRQGNWTTFWRELRLYKQNEAGAYYDLLKILFWYLVLPARISDKFEGLRYLLRRIALPWRPIQPGGPRFPLASQREHYDAVFGIHNLKQIELLDKMAAQFGVEMRLPFLDRRLVVFTMSLPWEENTREGWARRLEREALDGLLPASIARRRDKGDFGEFEFSSLIRAGFKARDLAEGLALWRRKMKEVWTEVWIKGKMPRQGKNTFPRAFSNTAI